MNLIVYSPFLIVFLKKTLMLKDKFNRVHDYLRISITDRCNLRCQYCTPEDLPKGAFAHPHRMSVDEIDAIASCFINAGVKKIRLTGGEPLVRKDVKEIIQKLAKYPIKLAITTNGVFIHEFIDVFKESGLKSVNISLDTLKKDNYFSITKRDEFTRVINNINLLLENSVICAIKLRFIYLYRGIGEHFLRFIERLYKTALLPVFRLYNVTIQLFLINCIYSFLYLKDYLFV